MGDDAAIVFHFHLKLIVRQDPLPQLEDLGERPRLEAVVDILPDVGLEDYALALPGHPAAIDEVFHDMADFSNVGVRRDGIAIRQNKTRNSVRVLFEGGAKIGEFHAAIYMPI